VLLHKVRGSAAAADNVMLMLACVLLVLAVDAVAAQEDGDGWCRCWCCCWLVFCCLLLVVLLLLLLLLWMLVFCCLLLVLLLLSLISCMSNAVAAALLILNVVYCNSNITELAVDYFFLVSGPPLCLTLPDLLLLLLQVMSVVGILQDETDPMVSVMKVSGKQALAEQCLIGAGCSLVWHAMRRCRPLATLR
jgi:hypothetical protein